MFDCITEFLDVELESAPEEEQDPNIEEKKKLNLENIKILNDLLEKFKKASGTYSLTKINTLTEELKNKDSSYEDIVSLL